MSNCTVAVVRHAEDGSWEEVTNLPAARAMCNYNGQIVISPCIEPVPDEEEGEVLPPYGHEDEYFLPETSVEFTVFGGKRVQGYKYSGNCIHPLPGPPTTTIWAWEGEFWYSDDNGVTFHAVAGTYNSFLSPGDPAPWSYLVAIDPTLFNTAGRRFYIHYRVNYGTWIISYMMFYVDYTKIFVGAEFWMRSEDYPDVPNGWIYTFWRVWSALDAYAIEDLYVALFDRSTDTMIPGSELIFTSSELLTFKTAYIVAGDFPFTHEIEIRAKSDATYRTYAPWLQEAHLFINFSNIGIFTSFQRVGRGSLSFGWGSGESPYPEAGQIEYMWSPPNRWMGGVDCSARTMYNKVPGVEIRYQICANTYADPVWVPPFPYDPLDPGDAYEYQALWNNGVSDEGLPPDGYNRVDGSELFFTTPDFSAWQNRVLKTTEDIAALLTDDSRYCQLQLDDQNWVLPMNAQILSTVRGNGPLDLPDTFIYLLACSSFCLYSIGPITPSTTVALPTSYKTYDPSKYDGTIQAWFEVTLHNSNQVPGQISLIDSEGTTYATIDIPVTEVPIGDHPSYMDWQTYRAAITLPTTIKQMGIRFPIAIYNAGIFVKEAFIRIRQTGATKSRTFVPLFSFGYSWDTASVRSGWIGASAEVITNGVYLPNFDEPDYLNSWSYAMDGVPIVKLGE
jgi:hypothetical protein